MGRPTQESESTHAAIVTQRVTPTWLYPIVGLVGLCLYLVVVGLARHHVGKVERVGVRAMQEVHAHVWRQDEQSKTIEADASLLDSHVNQVVAPPDHIGFDDRALIVLNRFPNLKDLNLIQVPVSDTGFESLLNCGGLRSVKEVSLSGPMGATGDSIRLLGTLPEIQMLAVSELECDGSDFAGFTSLRTLFINQVAFTNADLDAITTQLPLLHHLSLRHTQINDQGLDALARCRKLTNLDLTGSKVSDAGVAQIHTHLPHLSILTLDQTQLTDACLVTAKRFANLSRLSVKDTRVTRAAVDAAYATNPRYTILDDRDK